MSCHLCHVRAVSLLPDEEDELVTGDGESPQQLEVGQVVRGEAGGHSGLHGLVVSLGFLGHTRQVRQLLLLCTVRTWSAGDIRSFCRERMR